LRVAFVSHPRRLSSRAPCQSAARVNVRCVVGVPGPPSSIRFGMRHRGRFGKDMCPGRLAAPKTNTSATTYGLAAVVCHICPPPRKHHGAEASQVEPGLRRVGDKLAVGTEATCRADGYTVHRGAAGYSALRPLRRSVIAVLVCPCSPWLILPQLKG